MQQLRDRTLTDTPTPSPISTAVRPGAVPLLMRLQETLHLSDAYQGDIWSSFISGGGGDFSLSGYNVNQREKDTNRKLSNASLSCLWRISTSNPLKWHLFLPHKKQKQQKKLENINMEIFFHFTVELLDIRCLVLHCSNPFSVFVYWRLRVSTSYLWMLSIEPGLASELFRTSQIMPVSLPLKSTEWMSTRKLARSRRWIQWKRVRYAYIILEESNVHSQEQRDKKKRNCKVWFQWDFTVKPLNRAAHVEKEDCPFSQPRLYWAPNAESRIAGNLTLTVAAFLNILLGI